MTAKDVARELNISPSTLSLILNNKPGISEKLRNEILTKVHALGYSNLIKAKPASPSSDKKESAPKNICFLTYVDSGTLVGTEISSSVSFIIEGIEKSIHAHGYYLTFLSVFRERLAEGLERIAKADYAGFILFAPELSKDQLFPFMNLGIPFVMLENAYNELPVSSVKENNCQGIQAALDYLIQSGHRKIGYLTSMLDFTCFKERQKCAVETLCSHGLEPDENFFVPVGYPDSASYEGTKKMLETPGELPTAFLADCDLVAIGAMKAFKEMGYQIPKDISFIGFDNLPICTMIEPNLTTVHIFKNSLGTEAAELLFRLIEQNTDCPIKAELYTSLIIRNSVSVIGQQPEYNR